MSAGSYGAGGTRGVKKRPGGQTAVGGVHPRTGAVCVGFDDAGIPRWQYPKGHPRHGVARQPRVQVGGGKRSGRAER